MRRTILNNTIDTIIANTAWKEQIVDRLIRALSGESIIIGYIENENRIFFSDIEHIPTVAKVIDLTDSSEYLKQYISGWDEVCRIMSFPEAKGDLMFGHQLANVLGRIPAEITFTAILENVRDRLDTMINAYLNSEALMNNLRKTGASVEFSINERCYDLIEGKGIYRKGIEDIVYNMSIQYDADAGRYLTEKDITISFERENGEYPIYRLWNVFDAGTCASPVIEKYREVCEEARKHYGDYIRM